MTRFHRVFVWLFSAFFAASLIGCAGDRSFGERVDDQTIETKVKAALLGAPDVSGTNISVEVRNGAVQLSGFVKSRTEAERAIDLARRVDGVRTVVNRMDVRG